MNREDPALTGVKDIDDCCHLQVIENDIHGTKLAPSDPVNAAWHALLLYPADYLALCSSLLQVKGTVLDHNPRARFDSLRPERYAVTLDKYQSVFATDASKPFWHTLEHIRFQCTQIAFSVPNAQPPQVNFMSAQVDDYRAIMSMRKHDNKRLRYMRTLCLSNHILWGLQRSVNLLASPTQQRQDALVSFSRSCRSRPNLKAGTGCPFLFPLA